MSNRILFDPPTVPHVVLDATFADKLLLHYEVTRTLSLLAQRRDRSMRVTITVVENMPGQATECETVLPEIALVDHRG